MPFSYIARVALGLVLTTAIVFCAFLTDSFPNSQFGIALAQEELDLSALDGEAADQDSDAETEYSEPVELETERASTAERAKFLDLLLASGWIGCVLLVASIFSVSLIIRLCFALRRSLFVPASLERELSASIARGSYGAALKATEEDKSFLARVAAVGLRNIDLGWSAAEKALEDAASAESAALCRKTEPLSIVGAVAPMLGLLGTVLGMVTTFGELAVSDASGRNLANGIYFALVTTVDGLIVAIPVLVAHSLLNIRIAKLVADSLARVDAIFEPARRRALSRSSSPPNLTGLREVSRTEAVSLRASDISESVSRESTNDSNSTARPILSRPSLSLKNRN